jgi:hypothetical protein
MQNSLKYLAVLVLLFVVACAGPGENTPILEDTPETVSGEILEPGFDILDPDTGDVTVGLDVFTDTAVFPGDFGQPCEEEKDCSSAICVPGPEGKVCSALCVEDVTHADWLCGEIFIDEVAVDVYLMEALFLCRPCHSTADCGLGEFNPGTCVDHAPEGGYCALPCGSEGACPDGYVCETGTDADGEDFEGCLPEALPTGTPSHSL